MAILTKNKRFICFSPREALRKRIICFHPAGAGASFFSKWSRYLPSCVEFWSAQLPEREYLTNIILPSTASDLIDYLMEDIIEISTGNFDIYGHSFGAAMAFHVASTLEDQGVNTPKRLYLSGRKPMDFLYDPPLSSLNESEFMDHLMGLGGMPQCILREEKLLQHYLQLIKRDLYLNEKLRTSQRKIESPIDFIYSRQDIALSIEDAHAWARSTQGSFNVHTMDGHHYFQLMAKDKFFSILSE